MAVLKNKLGRWTVPALLAAVVATALAVSPAIGGLKFVTGKKVNKTIAKKTNATELRVNGTKKSGNTDLSAGDAVIATLGDLPQGNYVVTSTFSLTRDTSGLVVACQLSAGSATDKSATFGPTGGGNDPQENVALSVTGSVPAGGSAQLRCSDGSVGTDGTLANIEITALRVPKITVKTG